MATVKIMLVDGLNIGNVANLEAEIREAGVGDMLDANDESEKVISTPDGYQLIASPLLVGINTLRRQIVRIGDIKGPLTLGEIRKLTPVDLDILQSSADELEKASLKRVSARGRGEGGAA